jgi:Transcriptional regulator PadR-like family
VKWCTPSTIFPSSIGRFDLCWQGNLLIMAEPQLTSFEHILIGLVCLSPASGYDLKRIFAYTPMGIYQPSCGSLYPALRRLEAKGLVKAVDGAGHGQAPPRVRADSGRPGGPRDLAAHAGRSVHGLA